MLEKAQITPIATTFREALFSICVAATHRLSLAHAPQNVNSIPPDKREFVSAAQGLAQCPWLIPLMSKMAGVDLAPFIVTGPWPFMRYAIIVPLANSNNHSYPLGRPCMMHTKYSPGALCLNTSGNTGNVITMDSHIFRVATIEEIRQFCLSVYENTDDLAEIRIFVDGYSALTPAPEPEPLLAEQAETPDMWSQV